MSRTFFSFIALSVVLTTCIHFAASQEPNQDRRARAERRAKEVQQRQEAIFKGKPPAGTAQVVGRSVLYSIDKGFGNTMALLEAADNPNISKELGFTDDQVATMKAAKGEMRVQMLMLAPKYVNRFKTMTDADHQAIQEDIQKELEAINQRVEGLVTPEQKTKARTLVFQAMGGVESPLINMDALSTLNLTDEQKEKARASFKEMEKERLAQMEEGLKLVEKAIEKGGMNMSPEDRKAIEEEGRALQSRIIATGKKLGDDLRTHLTDEQRNYEKSLIANRPAYLPRLPRQMRGDFTEQYSPGLDSWVPGQGTPKDRSDEKKRRRPFPLKEESDEDGEE